jgi:hypothetical protein
MRLRKYKKFSELSREVPIHREIKFIPPQSEREYGGGRPLKFFGYSNDDVEDAEIIEDEEVDDNNEENIEQS